MKRVLAMLAIVSALFCVSGCGEGVEWGLDENIIGTWEEINPRYYPDFKVTFNADGSVYLQHNSYSAYSGSGAWYTADKTLTISLSSKDYSDEYEYRVVNNHLVLTTLDGYVIECIRL